MEKGALCVGTGLVVALETPRGQDQVPWASCIALPVSAGVGGLWGHKQKGLRSLRGSWGPPLPPS